MMRSVAVFEQYYRQNWMYVVLSCVWSMKGLYLDKPQSLDMTKYSMCPKMKEMIAEFNKTLGIKLYMDNKYIGASII
jgi:hypothetical protein